MRKRLPSLMVVAVLLGWILFYYRAITGIFFFSVLVVSSIFLYIFFPWLRRHFGADDEPPLYTKVTGRGKYKNEDMFV